MSKLQRVLIIVFVIFFVLVGYHDPLTVFIEKEQVYSVPVILIRNPVFLDETVVIVVDRKGAVFLCHVKESVFLFPSVSYQAGQ